MRRFLVVLLGLAAAITAGLVFLAVVGLLVPATRDLAGHLTFGTALAMVGALVDGGDPGRMLGVVILGLWSLTSAMLVLPVFVAAVLGEIAGFRGFVWYGAVTGALTAVIPWIGHVSGLVPDADETKVLTFLFVTGAFTGLVYWLLTGRGAAGSDQAPDARLPRD